MPVLFRMFLVSRNFEDNCLAEKFKFIAHPDTALALGIRERPAWPVLSLVRLVVDLQRAFVAVFLDLISPRASRGSADSWYVRLSLARFFLRPSPPTSSVSPHFSGMAPLGRGPIGRTPHC